MANSKQPPFPSYYAEKKRRAARLRLRACGSVLLVFSLGMFCLQTASAQLQPSTAQPEPNSVERRKAELEVEKLELENAKLREMHAEWLTWLPALIGLLIAALSIPASIWSARLARANALDQATHEERLESYPPLVKAMSPLALYFPVAICLPGSDPAGAASISPSQCGALGHEMSKWYFEGGGLLMSTETRDAYFRLARALTRASRAPDLKVPSFPANAVDISKEKIETYVGKLGMELKWSLRCVDAWTFGGAEPKIEGSIPRRYKFKVDVSRQLKWPLKYLHKWTVMSCVTEAESANLKHNEFKDFVFLQQLSSDLRTKLADDLSSRGRPS